MTTTSLAGELLLDAAHRAVRYIGERRTRRVFPTPDALAVLEALPAGLPTDPTPANEVLAQLDVVGSPATVASTGGRYFGYVNGGSDPMGAAAAVLAGAWDQNVALPAMSPAAARLDAIAIRWVLDLLDLPVDAGATFCAGASIANLTCILAARDELLRRLGWSVAQRGLAGAPSLKVVASAEIHVSVIKALRVAGIGSEQIVWAPVDENGRVRPPDLPAADDRTIVVLQAGNVNTGHSDPFVSLAPAVRAQGAWLHVDGAFGLWAAASPAHRHHTAGVEQADSWAVDTHKLLNAPYDSGIAIVQDERALRQAMWFDAAYLATDEARALTHLGLQMSQRARGVETWAIIAHHGRSGIAQVVDRMCRLAERFHLLLAIGGAEILSAALNQVLVRYTDDTTTDAVVDAVQTDGTCWVGATTWQGRRAMRVSVCDATTTADDIECSARAILQCWQHVRNSTPRGTA